VTDDDATREWEAVTAAAVPCRCSHPQAAHYRDRRGRPVCGHYPCGCIEFRPREEAH
jgi:hypothetical protein